MNKKVTRLNHLGLCTLILVFAACQEQEDTADAGAQSDSTSDIATGRERMGAATDELSTDEQIEQAILDLANRTGVAVDAITVKEARAVQWGSGAMGCPKPGMNYTQALIPGMRVLLEADGTIYYYHGDRKNSLFFCPADRAEAPVYGRGQEVM